MPDWDKAYRETQAPLFGDMPTEFVRAVVGRADFLGAGVRRVLCLADGDGRNGRWLAKRGFEVTAIDLSSVATEQAVAKDRVAGVSVERRVADLADWRPDHEARWDAVFVIFLQCPSAVRNGAIGRACEHLEAGGWLVVEGFSRRRSSAGMLGPKDDDLLYDAVDIVAASGGMTVIEALEGIAWLSEGSRHRGYGDVVRLIARRM